MHAIIPSERKLFAIDFEEFFCCGVWRIEILFSAIFREFLIRIQWMYEIIEATCFCLAATIGQSIESDAREISGSMQNIFEFGANSFSYHDYSSIRYVHNVVSEMNLFNLWMRKKTTTNNSIFHSNKLPKLSNGRISRILGYFSYSSIIIIPSLLGGWSMLLAQENVRLLFGHTAATIVSK